MDNDKVQAVLVVALASHLESETPIADPADVDVLLKIVDHLHPGSYDNST
jgi:hypothetical protein